jgi:hypothetical protein
VARKPALHEDSAIDGERDCATDSKVIEAEIRPTPIEREIHVRGLRLLDHLEARIGPKSLDLLERRSVQAVDTPSLERCESLLLVQDRDPLDLLDSTAVGLEKRGRGRRVVRPALGDDPLP